MRFRHGAGRGAFAGNIYDDLMWVYAKKLVFLGAGTLGTTEILLRSRQLGLETSARVGVGLSGNGDMLSFGYVRGKAAQRKLIDILDIT